MKLAKDIMSSPVLTVDVADSVRSAAIIMAQNNIGSVCVLKHGKLHGILTERDLAFKIVRDDLKGSEVLVECVMHSPVTTAHPQTNVFEVSTMMEEGHFRRVPIVENGALVGILTETDVEVSLRDQTIDELKTKIKELEVFNKMAIGRELKMAELKKRIAELEGNRS